jgi:hypothetical protein
MRLNSDGFPRNYLPRWSGMTRIQAKTDIRIIFSHYTNFTNHGEVGQLRSGGGSSEIPRGDGGWEAWPCKFMRPKIEVPGKGSEFSAILNAIICTTVTQCML